MAPFACNIRVGLYVMLNDKKQPLKQTSFVTPHWNLQKYIYSRLKLFINPSLSMENGMTINLKKVTK